MYLWLFTDEGFTLDLTVILLVLMISITLLLIVVLLITLKFIMKRLKKKPLAVQNGPRRPQRPAHSRPGQARIIHTQLDMEMPYAVTAPPTYSDTLLADRRVQSATQAVPTESEEAGLITQDSLDNNSEEMVPSHTPQLV